MLEKQEIKHFVKSLQQLQMCALWAYRNYECSVHKALTLHPTIELAPGVKQLPSC